MLPQTMNKLLTYLNQNTLFNKKNTANMLYVLDNPSTRHELYRAIEQLGHLSSIKPTLHIHDCMTTNGVYARNLYLSCYYDDQLVCNLLTRKVKALERTMNSKDLLIQVEPQEQLN